MTRRTLAKFWLALLGGGIAVSAGAGAVAQSLAQFEASCAGTANVACVAQIGSTNNSSVDQTGAQKSRALVYIRGDNNGTGIVSPVSSGALAALSQTTVTGIADTSDLTPPDDGETQYRLTYPGSPIRMPANLASGAIIQRGRDNRATVVVGGDGNDFHVSQLAGNNSAEQNILGHSNTVVALQGGSDMAVQSLAGSGNVSYAAQSGGNNFASAMQTADASRILLEQNGGSNSANLAQVGFGHSIALRQTGGVSATIAQYGSAKSIAVEQSAGIAGVSAIAITQR